MKKRVSLFMAIILLLLAVMNSGMLLHAETAEILEENDLEKLISELPEVSDPLGTEYFFYNQLSDIEKVLYRQYLNATWESPDIVLTGIEGCTEAGMDAMAQRALSAAIADGPELHMKWQRWCDGELSEDGSMYMVSLRELYVTSEYMLEKADARIDQIVEIVGMEGDTYSRVRDLIDYMCDTMDYYSYYPFAYNIITGVYDDTAYGCLLKNNAICAGFCDTFKILCDELNIPCITVGNAGHAWNMVRLDDGNWYLVDTSIDAKVEQGYQLLSQSSLGYIGNSNYFISDMYIGVPGDFEFPDLSVDEYQYADEYTASYHKAETKFTEPDSTFIYSVNEDGTSCTITEYQGKEEGDLVIPKAIDGYAVTHIGEAAFYACNGFTGDLVIPDSVTHIGQTAFQYCYNLKGHLVLSENLVEIGRGAFTGCANLSGEINFPETVKVIEDCSFYGCKSFEGDLILPNDIETIGLQVFFDCSGLNGTFYLLDDMEWSGGMITCTNIQNISVSENHEKYSVIDGVLYSKDMKTLVACAPGKTGELIIQEGVESIAAHACDNVTGLNGRLSLPDTLLSIGRNAFACCGFTGELVIPDSVTSIGEYAFLGVEFGGRLTIGAGVEKIEASTFWGCRFMGDLVIPDTVTYIEDDAFYACGFDGNIYMSKNIQYIGSWAISDTFGNELDLSDSEVVLEKDAFFNAVFSMYSCNCGQEYVQDIYLQPTEDYEGDGMMRCPHCGGRYRITIPKLESEFDYGDLNDDGVIDSVDAVLMTKRLAGYNDVDINTEAADVSGDGEITAVDAVILLKRLAGYDI